MKRKVSKIAIFLYCIFFTGNSYADNSKVHADKNSDVYLHVINLLFDSPKIDINNRLGFIWEPNHSESLNFNVSFDGMCHTKLDTILNFKNNSKEDCVIFVFKTQTYSNIDGILEVRGCHFCTATISIAIFCKTGKDTLTLKAYSKHFTDSGLFGGDGKEGIGRFSIVKIEDELFLSLRRPIGGNNGYNYGIEDLYYIDGNISCKTLGQLLSYEYYIEKNYNVKKYNLDLKESTAECLKIKANAGVKKEYFFNSGYCKFLESVK